MSPAAREWNKLLNRMGYKSFELLRDHILELKRVPGYEAVGARPDLTCDDVFVFVSGHLTDDRSAGAIETRRVIERKVRQCLRRGVAAVWIDGSMRLKLDRQSPGRAKREFDGFLRRAQSKAERLLRKFEHDGTPVTTIDTRKPQRTSRRDRQPYVHQPRSRRQRRQFAIAMA